ncbi:zinc finger BED domain-containing protein RICESLEEPER 2 [Capsella rubella]|uniref:zinc finger BED domain-containing protein RICESLEEPER 2 n=1 Tax=Capsella rubella TaxID=81985 RepID=UPI000CD5AF5C|nr:zinc finger BED domain-containing protein RICESLEEPER 2 [Capsella rubella]
MANKSQQVIKGNGSKQAASISEPMYREATNEMLVLGELPLSFVESVAWRHFSSRVNLYRPHSRRTPSRDIVQLYVKKKALLKKWINSNKQRVSLTTDIWVAPNTNNATTNTLALKKFQREFRLVSNDAFVLDGDYMHIRCIAHIINLIVRDGLHDLSKNLEAIRNGVSYVRSSHVKQKSFELRVNLGKLKRISLTLNVKTRWSSTYTMLTNALKYRVAFDKMLIEDRLYHDYFQEMDNGNTREGPPDQLTGMPLKGCLNAHKCYGEIVTIERNLSFLTNSRDDGLKNKAADMLKKFLKYWDGMNNINKMLIIATVFDPTKNLKFAKMCFEKLYGEDSVDFKAMGDYVFYVLDLVYKEYAAEKLGLVPKTKQHQSPEIPKKMDLVDDLGYQRMDMAYKEMVANNTDEVVRREL